MLATIFHPTVNSTDLTGLFAIFADPRCSLVNRSSNTSPRHAYRQGKGAGHVPARTLNRYGGRVVITASQRCETIALEHKSRQNFDAHCSSVIRRIRHARLSGNVRSPLFWGYSCVKVHSEYRPLILATLGARSILSCGEEPSLLFSNRFIQAVTERNLNGEIQCTKPFHTYRSSQKTNYISVRFLADFALQRQAKASQQTRPG
jgi:hypothetical protein